MTPQWNFLGVPQGCEDEFYAAMTFVSEHTGFDWPDVVRVVIGVAYFYQQRPGLLQHAVDHIVEDHLKP